MKTTTLVLGAVLCAAAGYLVTVGMRPSQGPAAPGHVSDAMSTKVGTHPGGIGMTNTLKPGAGHELAAFSGGCFWGVENTFRHVKGVVATAVGYTGGIADNPTYEMVCSHTTGHAESVLLEFDPKVITYKELLHQFWLAHDPTTPDRQGPDVGNNYRSAIWTFSDDQLKAAKQSEAEEQKLETAPITTQIAPIGKFWLAEEYHQQYDEKTGTNTCPPPRQIGG